MTTDEFAELGVPATARLVHELIGSRPVYVSVDIDVVDPAFAPGTGTPAPGGPSSREILALLRCVGGLHPVGFDVMEVSPPYDHSGVTALLATEIGAELLHQYARAHQAGQQAGQQGGQQGQQAGRQEQQAGGQEQQAAVAAHE
jgi:agmatinase/proclavaminate amidinohydrolase